MADSLVKVKISVWRDFTPRRALVLRQGVDEGHRVLSSDSELQEEIYTWHMREDPFGGVSDEDSRTKLRGLLIDRFDASKPPFERRMDALTEFFREVEQVTDAGLAEWTVSEAAPTDDEDSPYRLNPLLAFKLHLEWLAKSFGHQPGISVSVR